MSKIVKRSIPSLLRVEHAPWKLLCNFFKCFNKKILHTEEYFFNIVITTMISGVRHIRIRTSIQRSRPTLLLELFQWFDKYVGLKNSSLAFKSRDFKRMMNWPTKTQRVQIEPFKAPWQFMLGENPNRLIYAPKHTLCSNSMQHSKGVFPSITIDD